METFLFEGCVSRCARLVLPLRPAVPHSFLLCATRVFLLGPYFWVGACGFVLEDVASAWEGGDSLFHILFRSRLSFGLWFFVYFPLPLTVYLSHLVFL